LISWAAQTPNYINVGRISGPSDNLIQNTAAAAYVYLTSALPGGHGWSITDGGSSSDNMIITVHVPATTSITLNVNVEATVDWTTSGVFTSGLTHTYTTGNYTISISGATQFNYSATLSPYLTGVVQWGLGITDYSTAFQNCLNNFTLPDEVLTGVTLMNGMFRGCSAFNQPIQFNTSLVTNMSAMFNGCSVFNQPVDFDLSQVTNMNNMFQSCSMLNSTISFTNTSKLTTIVSMFMGCSAFDQPISFDTSQVTTMAYMFYGCSVFNQPVDFNTSQVTSMDHMFYGCSVFNQPVDFNTSQVTTMQSMFMGCSAFDQPVDFNTSQVTTMAYMFYGCSVFNQPVDFNTSQVTTMAYMFISCSAFNQPVDFNTSQVTTMAYMFMSCSAFNQPVDFNTSQATSMDHMFMSCSAFNQLVDFNTSQVTTIASMFQGCTLFNNVNQPIIFNTSQVTTMASMFQGCSTFNQAISFTTQNVTTMSFMFQGCAVFNQPLSFDTTQVTTMDSMFQDAVSFARPLNAWKLNSLVSMNQIFTHCGFNQSVYSATLNGWASQSMYLQPNVDVDTVSDSNNALICHTAVQAYNVLIGIGWSILDGGDCTNAPCFLKGTRILTPNGYVRIEKLYAGDIVLTHDGRKVPICKMHRSHPTPSPITLPYHIPKGTQVNSMRCLDDLYLSPEHAILIHSNKMVAMKYTTFQQVKLQSIHYYHIILPNYYTDTLIANGIVCESYGSAKKYNLHDGKYRTLISPYTYYNLIEPSQYIM
jgi:surface protein